MELHEPAPPAAFIPPAGRADAAACAADAEVRRTADAGPERNPPGPRRDRTRSIRRRPGMSLLQRLANVGLGRRDEDTEPPIAARASGPAMPQMPPLPERKPQRPIPRAVWRPIRYRNMPAPPGTAGPRFARPAGPGCTRTAADDHLDIPAFLRRQAN